MLEKHSINIFDRVIQQPSVGNVCYSLGNYMEITGTLYLCSASTYPFPF